MKVFAGFSCFVLLVLAALVYSDRPVRFAAVDTLRLQKSFWILGTYGINTPDRDEEMNTCLVSAWRGRVFVTNCQDLTLRTLLVKDGIVDFNMQVPMTVVVRQNQRTGKLSVHRKTVI